MNTYGRVGSGPSIIKGEMMTNEEKNQDRFDEFGIGNLPASEIAHYIAVRKNGEVVLCAQIPCRNCIFYGGNCVKERQEWLADEWLKSEAEPEKKEEKMEKDEIKVGDTVKVTTKNRMREGATGTVRTINRAKNGTKFYHVRFDGESSLYAFYENEIEKVKSKKTKPCIVVYRDGDTVTAKDLKTGEKASAVCSKDDTFDFHTGAFIAVSRLTHFVDDIKMMRLETEQIEEDIADMKMRFGALMGEGYKQPEGFSRKEEENEA